MAQAHSGRQQSTRSQQDQKLEIAIAMLLRSGVFAAAALVLLGGVLLLRHGGAHVPSYAVFHAPGDPRSTALPSIASIIAGLRGGSSAGIIGLGLLVLIATPVARVAFAAAGFARERDWLYTAISALVLLILVFSLLHGR